MNRNDIQDAETHQDPRDDLFMRAAARIGDLTGPFYGEERQRDVWNEASAVGFQLLLWSGMAAAAAMVWIGGRQALPYGVTLYVLVGAASWMVVVYARKLGVVTEARDLSVPRLLPYLLLLAAFVTAVVRAVPDGTFSSSFAYGAAGGSVGVVAVALVAMTRARRRATTS